VSSRCEPSFTPSRAPCAFSAAHNSAAVSSEASSHARLSTSFVAAKGQKGATAGSSEPSAREVLPGWPGPKRPPHELIPPGNLRTKALWPAPTRDFLVCANATAARSVFGHHPGSSWKGGDTSRGCENRRLGQMAWPQARDSPSVEHAASAGRTPQARVGRTPQAYHGPPTVALFAAHQSFKKLASLNSENPRGG